MTIRTVAVAALGFALAGAECKGGGQAKVTVDTAMLAAFSPIPDEMTSDSNPLTDAKIALGRTLFFEKKLSLGNDLSCNSCHRLDAYGADTGAVSIGHQGKKGGRNSPTVYNAAGHFAQFWDGRAPDVETQALGPILNPVEMAMPGAPQVLMRLRTDAGYRRLFAAAFPRERDPITYANLGRAIGAFERKLVTPSRWDAFLRHDEAALSDAEKTGFNTFVATGCTTCHQGTYVGGGMYMKLGLLRAWPDSADLGRMAVTHQPADRMVFKVPSLRDIDRTAPYFHTGTVRSLDTAVVWMARYQLGKALTPLQVGQIVTWLHALSGPLPTRYIAPPAAGPKSE